MTRRDNKRWRGGWPVALIVAGLLLVPVMESRAGLPSMAMRELSEQLLKRAGRKAGKAEVASLARQVEKLAARHGDEAVTAVRKVGPEAVELAARAGRHSDDVVKLMARYGDEAIWVISRPKNLAIFVRHGDDAVKAMIKHRHLATSVIEQFGARGARAVAGLNSRNARRLAMASKNGDLARIGRVEEVLEVIAKYGDRAVKFIWNNKGGLAVAAVLGTFIANPAPYINGTKDLATPGMEKGAETAGEIGVTMLETIDWTTILIVGMVAVVGYAWLRMRKRRRSWEIQFPPYIHRQRTPVPDHAPLDENQGSWGDEDHEGAGR